MNEEGNIEAQPIDNTQPTESNKNVSETSIINQSSPATPSGLSSTGNMEVHKHPHHITHKKQWGEYVLEFLMLFLAVFLGFIAENIREDAAEHSRSKEYAISLVQDLQHDTTSINVQVKSGKIFIAISDSLLSLSKERLENRTAAQFSFYTRFMYWTVPLSWNRATFEQIKNSGSLRYFKNYRLLEKLMKYDALVNEIEGEFHNHQTRGNMLLNQIDKIIDPLYHHDLSKYLLLSLDTMSKETKENFFTSKIESMENERGEIKEMLNMIVVQQRNLRFNDARLQRTKELANELISDLRKEYSIQ